MEAFFGNPNIQRQGKKARENAARRDVNTLPDPRTYAFVASLLGEAPDQQGFSALHPNADAIRSSGEVGYVLGLLGMAAPSAKAVKPVAKALAPKAADMVESYMVKNGMIQPITVWHGSPHKFDKFDASKIGTGEGAQAYGHGLYFAESPKVAQQYADELGTKVKINGQPLYDGATNQKVATTGNKELDDYLAANLWNSNAARKMLLEDAKFVREGNPEGAKDVQQLMAELRKVRGAIEVDKSGSLYKVDLPDEAVAKMLDWDKPLSQQPPEVQDVFGGAAKHLGLGDMQSLTGKDIYRRMHEAAILQGKPKPAAVKEAEMVRGLRTAGIPGIRYLDGGSRGTGAGTSNFVVFPGNESLLTILERNGEPVRGLLGQ